MSSSAYRLISLSAHGRVYQLISLSAYQRMAAFIISLPAYQLISAWQRLSSYQLISAWQCLSACQLISLSAHGSVYQLISLSAYQRMAALISLSAYQRMACLSTSCPHTESSSTSSTTIVQAFLPAALLPIKQVQSGPENIGEKVESFSRGLRQRSLLAVAGTPKECIGGIIQGYSCQCLQYIAK